VKTDRAGLVKVIYSGCPEIVSSRSIQVASMPVSSRPSSQGFAYFKKSYVKVLYTQQSPVLL
jgi:hypothetical protein